ncbi:hypothetical protein Rmf_48130 [Roseomonas fluvialis]|uniref:Uncharacterized protein n=2 Tax=Roseomonas fluvialis TaxID=1750527 RepID=A0ABM7YA26_9PROT|nr:hypothetical protein Rmf_48130 [Roseomonas fluvialis]
MRRVPDDVTARLLDRFGDAANAPYEAMHHTGANFAPQRYPRTAVSALVSPISKTKGDVRDV